MPKLQIIGVLLVSLAAVGCKGKEKRIYEAFERGKTALEANDFDRAIQEFTEVIRLDPTADGAYGNRGLAYHCKGEHYLAILDFDIAIRLNSESAAHFIVRAQTYLKMKLDKKAIANYEVAIRLSPNDGAALTTLAWVLATCPQAELRNGKRAVGLAKAACSLSLWKDGNDLENLAAAYAECGEFEKAIRWQQKAIEIGTGLNDKLAAQRYLVLYKSGKPCRDG